MHPSENHTDIGLLNPDNPVGWTHCCPPFTEEGTKAECWCGLLNVSPLGSQAVYSHCPPAHTVRFYGEDTQRCSHQSGFFSWSRSGEGPYPVFLCVLREHQFTEWMNEWMNSDASFPSSRHGSITVPSVDSFSFLSLLTVPAHPGAPTTVPAAPSHWS